MKVLFWVCIVIDVVAIVLFGLLGLAAAVPSQTNRLAALVLPFFIPAALLAMALWLYLGTQSAVTRAIGFVMAAAPLLVVVGGQLQTRRELSSYRDEAGELTQFRTSDTRALEAAIANHDAAAVSAAARGADLNARGLSGVTVLVLALRQLRASPEHLDVVEALLAAGADPNVNGPERPLQLAIGASRSAGLAPVDLLLDAGADPNATGEGGEPVFFIAGGAGIDAAVMERLLARGADLSARDAQGRSAVVLPATTRNWRVLHLLLERGAPWQDQRGPGGEPLAEYVQRVADAATPGSAEVVAWLRGRTDSRN